MRLNSLELQEYQPNRYPFLMIDVVEEVVPGKMARGYKNLTMNEWYFP
ncbi:MAG: beta-hydroxyacyl-ACP dehydratase, partial [Verrucomicrobiales bacterium VVV1]